jgi:NAD(P)-dependent dehydrogenase (short-subunit alcohol dehydrogenase family)
MPSIQSVGVLPINATGLRVVVTAAGSGIGEVIARSFQARGARVYICDVAEQLVSEALKSIEGSFGSVADVGDPAAVNRMFDHIEHTLGGVDVLINNAGIAGPTALVEDVKTEELEQTLRINLQGQFYCCKRVIPNMKKAGGGSIVNISSIAGRLAFAMRTPYAASKWGVVGFTKSLAMEVGRDNIRVNAILPGHVNSPRFQRVWGTKAKKLGITMEEMCAEVLRCVASGRTVEMQDIANMALYLTSSYGAAINGQAISVCGGVEMMG